MAGRNGAAPEEKLTGGRFVMAGAFRRMTGMRQLEERIHALEEELHTYQTTHVRLAEVLDLVQELLLPITQRDEAKVAELVDKFAAELGD